MPTRSPTGSDVRTLLIAGKLPSVVGSRGGVRTGGLGGGPVAPTEAGDGHRRATRGEGDLDVAEPADVVEVGDADGQADRRRREAVPRQAPRVGEGEGDHH